MSAATKYIEGKIADRELAAAVNRVYAKALKAAEKALLEPGEEGYDGSGDVPWAERSTRVAAGIMLAAKAADHNRETDVGHRAFGLLVLKERIRDHREWEKHAQDVDAHPVPTTTTTLDAEVTTPKKLEGK